MPTDLERAAEFVTELGIPVRFGKAKWANEVLPGLLIWRGAIAVDADRCLGPDDLLHEAGHLAVLPSAFRRYASGDIDKSVGKRIDVYFEKHSLVGHNGEEDQIFRQLLQASESEAIAWGYAAQVHLGLRPKLRFAGTSESECEYWCLLLSQGHHFGVNGLACSGMTTKRSFPKMLRWVQP